MKDLVNYINESLKATDVNKVVKKLIELFVNKQEVLIKKGDKLDLSSNYNITVPADMISELRTVLNEKYPFEAETHYMGYSNTNTDGILVSFNSGFKSENPEKQKISEKINKARMKKLPVSTRKLIDGVIIDTLAKSYEIIISVNFSKDSDYISASSYTIGISPDYVGTMIYYIRDVLGLSVNAVKNLSDKVTKLQVTSPICRESFNTRRKITPIEEKIQKQAIKLVPATVKTKVKKWIYEAIGKSSSNQARIDTNCKDAFNINSYGDCTCPVNMAIGLSQWIKTELGFNFRLDITRTNSVKYINIYK